jgi:hypothetical protein
VPLFAGPGGSVLVGYDTVKGDLVTADSPRSQIAPYAGRWAEPVVGKHGGVAGGFGVEGRFHRPGDAFAPMAVAQIVNDGGGNVSQVFVGDGIGTALRRLTSSEVNCLSPEVIDLGTVRYMRQDGRPGVASFGERFQLPTATGILRHIVGHGQSGAVGSVGTGLASLAAVTPYPPNANILMFNGGVVPSSPSVAATVVPSGNITSLTPAYDTIPASPYGTTGMLEMAEMMCGPFGRDNADKYLISQHGIGGLAYANLKQGTQPYANLLACVTAAKALAASVGCTGYIVEAIHWSQGGSDETAGVATYVGYLQQLQTNLSADIGAITGQTNTIPLFMCQEDQGITAHIIDPEAAILLANTTLPGIYLSATEYIDDFAVTSLGVQDPFHNASDFYRFRGSNIGKIMWRVIGQSEAWLPLYPISAQRYGRQVTITFNVPRPPIVLDTKWVPDPGQYGIQWIDSTSSATVIGARVISQNQIAVDLSALPTGASPMIGFGYAFPGAPAIFAGFPPLPGRTVGMRTCIRDSDPAGCPGTGRSLHNYCALGEIAVTIGT